MTVLFVGQNPAGPSGKSPSIRRLESWATTLGLRHYSFTNVGHSPGDKFKPNLKFLEGCCDHGQDVVALGGVASAALRRIGVPHFRLPHPSGLNRQLNDADYVRDVLSRCGDYIRRREHD